MRRIIWFSCGAASAVTAKLAINKYPDCEIVYCDTGSEHPDNKRFLKDIEKWIGKKAVILKNEKYKDIWEVFEKTKYIVGVAGARCTTELKRKLRENFQRPNDIQMFGFTPEEEHRASRFEYNYPDIKTEWPLIDNQISKSDCLAMLNQSGIEIPQMYKLGYKNNNCIGCPKGTMGYWNKIRIDFPDVFEKMSRMERKLNVSINKRHINGKRVRIFLDELEPDAGNYESEPDISCGILCQLNLDKLQSEPPQEEG